MLEQLTQLVQQFGMDAVVKNDAVPNEKNHAVMEEAEGSILSGLKDLASGGNIGELAGLLSGKSPLDMNNPIVSMLTSKLTGNLGSKLGLSSDVSSGIASGLIPQILGGLINKANDPNQPGFEISDIIGAISGGNNSGLMDAVSALTKSSGGIGGILGKLFGK